MCTHIFSAHTLHYQVYKYKSLVQCFQRETSILLDVVTKYTFLTCSLFLLFVYKPGMHMNVNAVIVFVVFLVDVWNGWI